MKAQKSREDITIVCAADIETVRVSLPGEKFALNSVGPDGIVTPCNQFKEGIPVYFCHVEFLGALEPGRAARGLAVIPFAVVYNGMASGFMACLDAYAETPALHGLAAIYMEPGAVLRLHGEGATCSGSGSIAIINVSHSNDKKVNIYQYRPSEGIPAEILKPAIKVY